MNGIRLHAPHYHSTSRFRQGLCTATSNMQRYDKQAFEKNKKKQKNIEQNSKTNKTNPWKRTRADHVVLCQCLFKHCCFFVFLNVFLFFCFCLVFLCFFFGFVDFDVMTHTRLNGRCKQTFEKTKKTKKTKKH